MCGSISMYIYDNYLLCFTKIETLNIKTTCVLFPGKDFIDVWTRPESKTKEQKVLT